MSDPAISMPAGRTLVGALAWLIYAMDQADEDVLDTDTAVRWMEDVAFLLGRLPAQDRRGLTTLIRSLADETTDDQMRSAYVAFIEGYGLDENLD